MSSSSRDPLGAFSETDDLLFSVGWTRGSIIAFTLPSLARVAELNLPGLRTADDVKYVSDECVAVTSRGIQKGSNQSVYIVDVSQVGTLKLLRRVEVHTNSIRRVRVLECSAAVRLADSKSGRLCATVSSDKTLNCWGAEDGKSKCVMRDAMALYALAELPWIDCVAVAGSSGALRGHKTFPQVRVFDVETQARVHEPSRKTKNDCSNSHTMYALEKHVERRLILGGTMSGYLQAYDFRAEMSRVWSSKMPGDVMCVRCAPETHNYVVRTDGGNISVLDERKMGVQPSLIRTFQAHATGACNTCDILRISENVWCSSCHEGDKGTSLWTLEGKILKTAENNGEGLAANSRYCNARRFGGTGGVVKDHDIEERFEYLVVVLGADAGVAMRASVRFAGDLIAGIDGVKSLLVSLL